MRPSDSPLQILWDSCDRQRWTRLLQQAGKSSLEQSWAYGEAISAHARQSLRRGLLVRGEEPLALVQVFARHLAPLGYLNRVLRGPVWIEPELDDQTRLDLLRAIRASFRLRRRELLLWLPELPDDPSSEAALRSLGSRRMVTGYSSAWLDLSRSEGELRAGLHVKWRNALKSAERGKLRIKASHGGRVMADSLARYDSFRRGKRFLGPDGGFIARIAEAGQRDKETLLLNAELGGEAVAGIVLVRHGASATYFAGWTSPEGRRHNAHNLLLWQGICRLREAGTQWLDLGGINPAAPGVARFKLGLGGKVFTLTGTYI